MALLDHRFGSELRRPISVCEDDPLENSLPSDRRSVDVLNAPTDVSPERRAEDG
jgi:hypothetical protein